MSMAEDTFFFLVAAAALAWTLAALLFGQGPEPGGD
jgi:hypothetical protein